MVNPLDSKVIAEESEKTKKARAKLLKRVEDLNKKITPQAIKRKSDEIIRWISRNASDRVQLKTKSIKLFDENENTAELSQKTSKVALQLQVENRVSSKELSEVTIL
jgi:hypothetical protein